MKREPERQVFQHIPRGLADVNVSEKHVRSLLLHKTFFSLENFGEIAQKVILPVPIMAQKSTLPANVLKMRLQGQRLMSSILCTLLMMTSVFMTAPECLFVKPHSRALTACELPG